MGRSACSRATICAANKVLVLRTGVTSEAELAGGLEDRVAGEMAVVAGIAAVWRLEQPERQ